MQARDRDDVIDPGRPQRVVRRRRDQPALARDESGGDRACLAAVGVGDPSGQGIAGIVHVGGEPERPRYRLGRRLHRDLAEQRAHGADAAEIGVAGEVVAAGARGLRGRQQAGRGGDEVARTQRRRLLERDAHADRPLGRRHRAEARDPHHEAGPLLPFLEGLDQTRERRDRDAGQHRRRHPCDPVRARRKAEQGRDQRERDRKGHRPPSEERQEPGAGAGRRQGRPERGHPVRGGEEYQNPGTERHREPGEEPPLLRLDREAARDPAANGRHEQGGRPPATGRGGGDGPSRRLCDLPRHDRHTGRREAAAPARFLTHPRGRARAVKVGAGCRSPAKAPRRGRRTAFPCDAERSRRAQPDRSIRVATAFRVRPAPF